jgi:hypothetical protein
MRQGSPLKRTLKEPKGSHTLVGRFGESPKGGGFVTVWHVDVNNTGMEEYYLGDIDGKVGNVDDLKKMLKSMVKGDVKVVGNCPAKLPITEDYVVSATSIKNKLVGDFIEKSSDEKENKCYQAAKLKIDGRDMDFGTALNNFHMVRGPQMEKIKAAICSQGKFIKKQLQGCDHELDVLVSLDRLAGCGSDAQNYQNLLKTGRSLYRRELDDIFRNPDRIDTEFRGRQKDIDAAWDFVRKTETFSGFREWVQKSLL